MQENFYSDINLAGNKLLNAQISLETVDALPLNTETELIQLGRTVVFQNQLYQYAPKSPMDGTLPSDAIYQETRDNPIEGKSFTIEDGYVFRVAASSWYQIAEWVPISAGQEKFDELESKIDDVQMGIKHLKPVDYFATLQADHLSQSYESLAQIHEKCISSSWEKLSNGFSFVAIATAKGFSTFSTGTRYPRIEAFTIESVDDNTATIQLIDLQVGDRILERTSGIWEIVKISDTDYRFARPTDFPITNIDKTKYNGAYVFVQKGSPDVSADTGFIQAVENTADGAMTFEFVPYGTSPGMVKDLIDDTRRYANDLSEARDLLNKLDAEEVFEQDYANSLVSLAELEATKDSKWKYSVDDFAWIDRQNPEQYFVGEALTFIRAGSGLQITFDLVDADGSDINKYFEYKAPTWEELREMNKEAIKTACMAAFSTLTDNNFEEVWSEYTQGWDHNVNFDAYKVPVFKGKINIPKQDFMVGARKITYKPTKDFILDNNDAVYCKHHSQTGEVGSLVDKIYNHRLYSAAFWYSSSLGYSGGDVPENWTNLKKREHNN